MNLRKDHYRFALWHLALRVACSMTTFVSQNLSQRPSGGVVECTKHLPRSGRVRSLFSGYLSVLEATHGDGFEAPSENTHELFPAWALAGLRGSKSGCPALLSERGRRPPHLAARYVGVPGTYAIPCSLGSV